MYPFPETAEREQQMGKIVIEDVGAVIGIVATVDEVKCHLLRNLWLPFALPKSASFLDPFLQNNDDAGSHGLTDSSKKSSLRRSVVFWIFHRFSGQEQPPESSSVFASERTRRSVRSIRPGNARLHLHHQYTSPETFLDRNCGMLSSSLQPSIRLQKTIRIRLLRFGSKQIVKHREFVSLLLAILVPLNYLPIRADLRSKVESLVRETALAAIVVVPGGSVGAPAGNIRRNGPRKHQRRWIIIDVRFPALFLRPKLLLLLSMLRLGGDESEKLLPETGSANADAATNIGKVLLTPHSYDRTPSVQLTVHIQVRPWEARIPARNPDIRGGYGF
nr:hypothetical protein Iba_chr09dCG1460 [Ipomoea batatas]